MATHLIRVGIIDDDPTDCADLVNLVGAHPKLELVFAFGSFEQLQEEHIHIDYGPVDVVLVDLFLGAGQKDGLTVIDYLKTLPYPVRQPRPKMLVVSSNANDFTIELARMHGAAGVVRKALLKNNTALLGQILTSVQTNTPGYFTTWVKSVPPLKDYQRQILCGLCRGRTQGEIAEEMHLATSTINTHTQKLRHTIGGPELTQFQLAQKAKEWCCVMN